jgi:hypothetical protein
VDDHELISLIAPRAVLMIESTTGGSNRRLDR